VRLLINDAAPAVAFQTSATFHDSCFRRKWNGESNSGVRVSNSVLLVVITIRICGIVLRQFPFLLHIVMDFVDKEKAKHQAKEQAKQMYDQQYGGMQEGGNYY